MNKRQLDILVSPVFVAGLCLLLLNDFIFKNLFHNGLTGKLSDFTGLFIFPLFWVTFFSRYKKSIYISTAISFVLWKSSYSQPLIDYWNSLSVLPLSRTVDQSDLIALFVLPLSHIYSNKRRENVRNRLVSYVLAAISVFAFTATSFRTKFDYGNRYYFPISKVQLLRRMYQLNRRIKDYYVSTCQYESPEPIKVGIEIPTEFCFHTVNAEVSINEEHGQSIVTLVQMGHRCPEGRNDKQRLLDIFEKEFVERVKQESLSTQTADTNVEREISTDDLLKAKVDIFLVPFGEVAEVKPEILAGYFKSKYGLNIKTLPRLPLDENTRNCYPVGSRSCTRPSAAKIVASMQSAYSKIAQNPKAIIIGIADDMYIPEASMINSCAYHPDKRFAVISLQSLNPITYCEPANSKLLEMRLEKTIEQEIKILNSMMMNKGGTESARTNYEGCAELLSSEYDIF
jgi:predicted Zn-dependent protease